MTKHGTDSITSTTDTVSKEVNPHTDMRDPCAPQNTLIVGPTAIIGALEPKMGDSGQSRLRFRLRLQANGLTPTPLYKKMLTPTPVPTPVVKKKLTPVPTPTPDSQKWSPTSVIKNA